MGQFQRLLHFRSRLGWMLVGVSVVLLLTAAPATAEISSADAYGGQAQVLGKPVRHRAHGTAKTQSSNQTGSPASSGSGAATGAGPGGSQGVVGGRGNGTGTGMGMGMGMGASEPAGSSGSAGGAQSPPIAAAEVADQGSLSLSGLDVLLLVAILVGLFGVGVLIRRLARQSE
jgi:cobalamin biosynthesis Mg chelatase CobN